MSGGIVRAPRPSRNFTILNNDLIEDTRLSFRAMGVLIAVLSKPDNWQTRSDALARERKEGRDAVRTALGELGQAGYLVRSKVRGADGRIRTVSVIYDSPQPQGTREDWAKVTIPAGQPGAGFPGAGFPGAGNPGPFTSTENKNDQQDSLYDPSNGVTSDAGRHRNERETRSEEGRADGQVPRQRRPRKQQPVTPDTLLADLGATEQERAHLIPHITEMCKPRTIAWWTTAAGNGTLSGHLEEHRAKIAAVAEQERQRQQRLADERRVHQEEQEARTRPCEHGMPGGLDCEQCLWDRLTGLYDKLGGKRPPFLRQAWGPVWDRIDAARRKQEASA